MFSFLIYTILCFLSNSLSFICLFTYDNFVVEKKKTLHPFHGSLNREERNEFIEKLQKNIIVFRYKKRDGSIRKAEGTLHPKYLPPAKSDKEFVRPEYQIVYYDLEKKSWRSLTQILVEY